MTSRSFVLASAIALSAIASNAVAQQLPDRLKDLQDARASVRIRAFYRLLSQHEVVPSRLDARQGTRALLAANPAAGRTIGGALIRLLERENHE
jgi:hypothetical protein